MLLNWINNHEVEQVLPPLLMPLRNNYKSLISLFSLRSLSSLRLTPSKSSGDGWDIFGVTIDKEILETILANHYSDPSLKVVEKIIPNFTNSIFCFCFLALMQHFHQILTSISPNLLIQL